MHNDLLGFLKQFRIDRYHEIKATLQETKIFSTFNVGDIIQVRRCLIHTARDGVGAWHRSVQLALLQYYNWALCDDGFALEFHVLASYDDNPYNPPFNKEYSGFKAQIRGPACGGAEHIKVVPKGDLPLFINWPHKTPKFLELLQGEKK